MTIKSCVAEAIINARSIALIPKEWITYDDLAQAAIKTVLQDEAIVGLIKAVKNSIMWNVSEESSEEIHQALTNFQKLYDELVM